MGIAVDPAVARATWPPSPTATPAIGWRLAVWGGPCGWDGCCGAMTGTSMTLTAPVAVSRRASLRLVPTQTTPDGATAIPYWMPLSSPSTSASPSRQLASRHGARHRERLQGRRGRAGRLAAGPGGHMYGA